MCTCERVLPDYKCSDSWIRQEYTGSEVDIVQNRGVRRSSHENSKGRMKWTFASKNQLLDWYQIADKEMAMCLWDLRKYHYSFSLHSLVLFFVFLE